jgi:glycosyltransferase involved in cell wall biosynthesis
MTNHRWHILTPELPPGCGGVGDYTVQVAEGLAAGGDRVSVYAPGSASSTPLAGVEYVGLPDRFGPASERALDERIDRASSRVLVQYVPAVFGRRGGNVAFCRWVRSLARDTDVRIMFHEPYLYFRWRPDHIFTAFAQRSMARMLLESRPVVYLSTDAWRRYLSPYGRGAIAAAVTLPIPSAVPRIDCAEAVRAARNTASANADFIVGHFGTYGRHVERLLVRAIEDLLSSERRVAVLCTGARSDGFVASMLSAHPAFRGRLFGTGRLPARDVSVHLQACDILLQPYPDGVTTRRTSVMAALANGRAVVTCDGALTESVWRDTGCVSMASSMSRLADATRDLLAQPAARAALEARASATYAARFDLRHTLEMLLAPAMGTRASA